MRSWEAKAAAKYSHVGITHRRCRTDWRSGRNGGRRSGGASARRRSRAEGLGPRPVVADADVDRQRRVEVVGTAHLGPHELAHLRDLGLGDLEQNSSCTWSTRRAPLPSSRSRCAMRIIAILMTSAFEPCMTKLTAMRSPNPRVCRFDARISGHGPAPSEQRGHVAVGLRLFDRARDEILDVRETCEVGVDVALRLVTRDLEVLRADRTRRCRRRCRS